MSVEKTDPLPQQSTSLSFDKVTPSIKKESNAHQFSLLKEGAKPTTTAKKIGRLVITVLAWIGKFTGLNWLGKKLGSLLLGSKDRKFSEETQKVHEQLKSAAEKMKTSLEKAWFLAMQRAHFLKPHEFPDLRVLDIRTDRGTKCLENKIERQIKRLLKIEGIGLSKKHEGWLKSAVSALKTASSKDSLSVLLSEFKKGPFTDSEMAEFARHGALHGRLLQSMYKEVISPSRMEKSASEIQCSVDRLDELLHGDPSDKDIQAHNRRILQELEKGLSSPAYQMLKEQGDHPHVRYLQELALIMLTQVQGMEAYSELGRSVGKASSSDFSGLQQGLSAAHDQMSEVFFDRESEGKSRKATIMKYAEHFFHSPNIVMGSFQSANPNLVPYGMTKTAQYDAYELNNMPHALGTAKIGGVAVQSLYAPSQTKGFLTRPLLRGVLDFIENEQFKPSYGPSGLTSLQRYLDINYQKTKSTEGISTRSLMEAQIEHPFSFVAMTLPLDGKFFDGKNSDGSRAPWTGVVEFQKEFRQHIFGENGRAHREFLRKNDNGFFFPATVTDEDIDLVLAQTTKALAGSIGEMDNGESAQAKRRVYQTLFNVLMRVHVESKLAKEIGPDGSIVTQAHCKQVIDRGNIMGMLYAITTRLASGQPLDDEFVTILAGLQDGRALGIDERVIMHSRFDLLKEFLTYVPQQELVKAATSLADVGGFHFAISQDATSVAG